MAVVVILLLLALPCLVAAVVGGFFLLSSRSSVVVTPQPVPVATKTVSPMRLATVTIAADGAVTLDGAQVEIDALPERLRQVRAMELSRGSSLSVTVQADATTPFEALQRVQSKISEAGVPFSVLQSETAPDLPLSAPDQSLAPPGAEDPPSGPEAADAAGGESLPAPMEEAGEP